MAKMGNYCKAYPISRFRAFNGWTEPSGDGGNDAQNLDVAEASPSTGLSDTGHLFLQEDFTVTDGIFMDENVVFANITPEWIEFCKNDLQFEIPEYASPASNDQVSPQG
jgi:hypothetical protein